MGGTHEVENAIFKTLKRVYGKNSLEVTVEDANIEKGKIVDGEVESSEARVEGVVRVVGKAVVVLVVGIVVGEAVVAARVVRVVAVVRRVVAAVEAKVLAVVCTIRTAAGTAADGAGVDAPPASLCLFLEVAKRKFSESPNRLSRSYSRKDSPARVPPPRCLLLWQATPGTATRRHQKREVQTRNRYQSHKFLKIQDLKSFIGGFSVDSGLASA